MAGQDPYPVPSRVPCEILGSPVYDPLVAFSGLELWLGGTLVRVCATHKPKPLLNRSNSITVPDFGQPRVGRLQRGHLMFTVYPYEYHSQKSPGPRL